MYNSIIYSNEGKRGVPFWKTAVGMLMLFVLGLMLRLAHIYTGPYLFVATFFFPFIVFGGKIFFVKLSESPIRNGKEMPSEKRTPYPVPENENKYSEEDLLQWHKVFEKNQKEVKEIKKTLSNLLYSCRIQIVDHINSCLYNRMTDLADQCEYRMFKKIVPRMGEGAAQGRIFKYDTDAREFILNHIKDFFKYEEVVEDIIKDFKNRLKIKVQDVPKYSESELRDRGMDSSDVWQLKWMEEKWATPMTTSVSKKVSKKSGFFTKSAENFFQ